MGWFLMFFIILNKFFSFPRKNIPFLGRCFSVGCIVRHRTAKINPERRRACERRGKEAYSLGSGGSQAAGDPFRKNGEPEKQQRSYVNSKDNKNAPGGWPGPASGEGKSNKIAAGEILFHGYEQDAGDDQGDHRVGNHVHPVVHQGIQVGIGEHAEKLQSLDAGGFDDAI